MLRSQTEIPDLSRDFLRACHSGDIHKVEALVEKHGIHNWTDFRHEASGDTALHVAAREGHMNIVKYLCEHFNMPALKAVNVTNKDTKRPLHEAAQFAQEDILRYLLEKGAEVDALKRGDWTPLMLACTKSGSAARQCIISLLCANASVHLRNKDGWTPFLIACRTGDENTIDWLLERYPEFVYDQSNNGRSALHIAGSSPLHEAIKHGNLDVVKCMVSLGADVNLVDNVGQTILHIAALTGNAKIVEYILEHKFIDVNCEASLGITPLMNGRRNNHGDVLKILIKHGAK